LRASETARLAAARPVRLGILPKRVVTAGEGWILNSAGGEDIAEELQEFLVAAVQGHRRRDPQPVLREWGIVFPDPRLAAAIVDRVTSTPTSWRPAPAPTGSPPARPPPGASGWPDQHRPGTMPFMGADTQTIIWNRAAVAGGGPAPGPGDTALAAALRLHNMIMNGGLDHALNVLTPEDLASAASGFRYLQLSDVAELVEQAQGAPSDDFLEELDARYSALIPRDQVIGDQFEALLQQRPDDFAPAS